MSTRRPHSTSQFLIGVARLTLIGAAAFFLLTPSSSAPQGSAAALDANAGPISLTVNRTADGQGLMAHADAPPGVVIYEIAAHLCLHDSNVHNIFDFGFQGRKCTNAAVGGSDVDQVVQAPEGASRIDLPIFRTGTGGTVRWVSSRGYDQEITCGPGAPCDVVFQLQITDDTVYYTTAVCWDTASCPAGSVDDPATRAPPPPPPAANQDATPAPVAATDTPAPATTPKAAPPTKPSGAASKGNASSAAPGPRSSASSGNGNPDARPSGISITDASTSDTGGPSRGTRVQAAAVAGLAGGALIAGLVTRGRRRITGMGLS